MGAFDANVHVPNEGASSQPAPAKKSRDGRGGSVKIKSHGLIIK